MLEGKALSDLEEKEIGKTVRAGGNREGTLKIPTKGKREKGETLKDK